LRLARHRRWRQALRRQHGISGGGKHCDDNDAQPEHCKYNDAQPERFSHGRRDRDVLYARTIVNVHYVS
jgi:hypothetical protein